MPSSKNYVRDYKQERRTAKKRGETASGSSSGDAKRHRARRILEKEGRVSKGDGKVIDHKKPIKSGGSNSRSNLRVKTLSANASHGGKIGNRKGKASGGRKGKK
jgi:hypothetical protein